MARNTWDSSRDNSDSIMRRGDDRTIDYGRGGDTRRGNEYRNSQWRNGSDSMRDTGRDSGRDYSRDFSSSSSSSTDAYRSADREDAYIEDRDMSYAERDRSRANPNRYESSRFANDRYTGSNDRNSSYDTDRYSTQSGMSGGQGMFSRDSSAGSRMTYGQSNTSQSGYGQSNHGGQNYNQSSGQQYGSTPWSASSESSSSNYGSSFGTGSSYGSSYGIHSGKGPKGYRRSDDRIKEEVSDALERHPQIDASELEVDVKDGIVTLKGHVEERRIKRMAEDAIENLPGVRDIRNELMVDQSLFQRAKEAIFGTSLESETASSQATKSSQGRSKH